MTTTITNERYEVVTGEAIPPATVTYTQLNNSSYATTTSSTGREPIAQTFYVNEQLNPNGCFVTGVSLFFSTKSVSMPISIELRPMEGGAPSLTQVLAISSLVPDLINTSDNGTIPSQFDFAAPVYLRPGLEYAILVFTNSADYSLWVATVGGTDVTTGRLISDQPMLGQMFVSRNGEGWVAVSDADFTMIVHKARFQTGTYRVALAAKPKAPLQASRIMTPPAPPLFETLSTVKYSARVVDGGTQRLVDVTPGVETSLGSNLTINPDNQTQMFIDLQSGGGSVAPMIDLTQGALFTKLEIDHFNNATVPETDPQLGSAKCKYTTMPIPLMEASNSVKAIVEATLPAGTSIQVFAKYLHASDTVGAYTRAWYPVPQLTARSRGGVTTLTFVSEGVTYDLDGATMDSFNTVMFKVVLWSVDSAQAPTMTKFEYKTGVKV